VEQTIVAREDELAEASTFRASARASFAALVFEGDPGIGKTTLWRHVVESAEHEGFRVLTTRSSSAETRLTFVALGDLLGGVEENVLDTLSEPQRRALDAALLRADVKGARTDRRSVGTAALSVLRALARDRPVLVAIDDVQWLDRASQNVLAFVFRRLEGAPVGVLATRRPDSGSESMLPREHVRRIRLGTLSLAAIHDVLASQLGRTFARPTLVRIEQTSGGNPFFALELGRALVESETPVSGAAPLPVPETLQELLERRVQRLPTSSRDALVLAATLAHPTLDTLDRDAVLAAEETGVVSIDERGGVEFTHPLLASSVYGSASPRRRREAHREAADLVVDPEERARHLALAADGPDEEVAAALIDAARTARARGAIDTAIELYELARRLTPADAPEALQGRQLELAYALGAAGDPQRAAQLLRDLIADAPAGPLRARAYVLLAFLFEWEGTHDAVELCERALADASEDAELRAEIHAAASRISDYETARKLSHAHAALELVEGQSMNPWVHAYALLAAAEADFQAGQGIRRDLIERAAAFESVATDEPPILGMMNSHSDLQLSDRLLGLLHLHADELDAARTLFEREYRAAADEGDEAQVARTLLRFVMIELRSGDWNTAEAHLRELDAVLERTGQTGIECTALIMRTHLRALRGDVEAARSTGQEATTRAIAAADDWQLAWAAAALGFLELSIGDLAAARAQLGRATEINDRIGLKEPRYIRQFGDHIETLIALGDLDVAQTVLKQFEEQAEATRGPWSLALSKRCRGLMTAAQGDVEAAERTLEGALEEHEGLSIPFELARTLLCHGRVLRRKRQKAAARVALQRALETFESLGARLWAQKARAEFERTHVREAPDELTPTEQRVASLAASGLTNKKIAEQLFVSPKTVEANLARVYRKLDIGSRAELGARMAELEQTIP
jgi:DNA-binding CsgD family transcriptional regulator